MIGNIRVIGASGTCGSLGREDGGGEIHGPEDHSGCVRVDALGGEDAVNFGPVGSEVAVRLRNEEAEGAEVTARASHVVEAGDGRRGDGDSRRVRGRRRRGSGGRRRRCGGRCE